MIPCVACKNLLDAVEAVVKSEGGTDHMQIIIIPTDSILKGSLKATSASQLSSPLEKINGSG